MLDLLWRMVKHPRDYKGLRKTSRIVFREKIDEGEGAYSFLFDLKKPMTWKAGEHAVFTMPNHRVTGRAWRAFSLASSSNEKEVRIGTYILPEPSDFKRKLRDLQPGDEIMMRGPFGEFHFHEDSRQIVGIAGGIGITPFRAMIKEIAAGHHPDINIHLIYAGRNNYYTYEEELRKFSEHEQISIVWVNTPDEVNAAIDQSVGNYANTAEYFISGSPGMIGAIRKRLVGLGVNRIFNDPFKGY